MGEISGVPTADIDNVDGFFTTQASGGGTPSTTPTISVTSGLFGETSIQVTNHSSYTNPNYQCTAAVGATTTVTDTLVNHTLESGADQFSDTMKFTDTNSATGTRTVTVKAQDFGNTIQSAAVTATYNVSGLSGRNIRVRGVNSAGTYNNSRLAIYECRFFEGTGQSGTSHPTNMVSNTVDSSNNSYYTISAGHQYSSYYPYKAFDSSSSIFAMWWALGTSTANNWINVNFDSTQFSTPPTIASIKIGFYSQNDATHFALETSSDGTSYTPVSYTHLTLPTNREV